MEFIPAHPNNYRKGRDGRPIQYVIIHSIVGSLESCVKTFQKPDRIASAHYIVGWNGRKVQMVNEGDTAYHAGNWEINLRSIGIEHDDQARPWDPRPDVLYESSAQLVADICRRYGIPADRAHIKKHSEVSLKGTACPAALDIERIVRRVQQILAPAPPPPPPPPPTPEWKQNLEKLPTPYQKILDKDVPLLNFDNGSVVAAFPTGSDIVVYYQTRVKGIRYYMTRFSVEANKPHGFNADDFDFKTTTTSTTSSTSSTSTSSSSTTTQPPVVVNPGFLDKLFKEVVELIKKIWKFLNETNVEEVIGFGKRNP